MTTHSRLRRAVAIAAVAILVGATNTACTMPLPEGTGKCDFSVDNPHESTTKPGYIDGKSKVKCTIYAGHTVSTLSITTKLQKLTSGTWTDVAGSSNTIVRSTVKTGVTYTGVSGFITCRKGTFRTAGRGSAYLDGEYSGSSQWGYGNSVKDPCD